MALRDELRQLAESVGGQTQVDTWKAPNGYAIAHVTCVVNGESCAVTVTARTPEKASAAAVAALKDLIANALETK